MQDISAWFPDLELHICGGEFFADFGSGFGHFFGDSSESLIESESGFDADDEQVEGIGELEEDFFLAVFAE